MAITSRQLFNEDSSEEQIRQPDTVLSIQIDLLITRPSPFFDIFHRLLPRCLRKGKNKSPSDFTIIVVGFRMTILT